MSPSLIAFYDTIEPIYTEVKALYLFITGLVLSRQMLFLALLLIFSTSSYVTYTFIAQKLKIRTTHRAALRDERVHIQELVKGDVDTLKMGEIPSFITLLNQKIDFCRKNKGFEQFEKPLLALVSEARTQLRALQYNAKVDELDFKKQRIQMEIEKLKQEKKEQAREEKAELNRIELDLNIKFNNAFFKESLCQEEIDILHKHNFADVNEYDVTRKKIMPFLVKQIMNHTPTHTFLVWSVERYLHMLDEIKYVQHHDTRYPDITFTYDEMDYALEIETGPLLRKKRQAAAKVKFLNKHYPERWMFIVSNKNLLSRYRELGPATPRSQVVEAINEMLGISL